MERAACPGDVHVSAHMHMHVCDDRARTGRDLKGGGLMVTVVPLHWAARLWRKKGDSHIVLHDAYSLNALL